MSSLAEKHRDVELTLSGLSCASCVGRAERALAAVPGVSDPQVNLATGRARLKIAGPETLTQATEALERAGYPATAQQATLNIADMTCASCVGRVERSLLALPGVTAAQVNLATGSATVSHVGLEPAAIAEAVTNAGYKATPADGQIPTAAPGDDAAALHRAFLTALALTLPIFIVEMGGHVFPAFHHWVQNTIPTQALWIAEFVLTVIVLAGPGRVFFRHGVPALLRGAPDMNSLVVLGASAAFLYSAVATFASALLPEGAAHVYYESAAVIVTLILLGRWLEARAKGEAGQAIRRLMELAPDTAQVERDGAVSDLPVEQIRPGDIIRLRPGERIAVDGEIIEGSGNVDESMLTGEPLPAAKAPGDTLTGGTINGNSLLRFRVTATGADTRLSGIVRMVEQAQAGKLPVQALVDKVTLVFVPVVMALSVLAFLLWLIFGPAPALPYAVVAAISVLIIACPCAMGLAIPVSILVGTGRGAQLGILFRRGDALQRLASSRIVAFDKTGTLTQGKPSIVGIETAGTGRDDIIRLAAGIEAGSDHPLALAIIAGAEAEGISPAASSEVNALPGYGVSGIADGRKVLAGNLAAIRNAAIAPDESLLNFANRAASQGQTPVHVAIDGTHVAAIAIADPPREKSGEAIRELHDLGLKTALISGDVQEAADAVGKSLGIDLVRGGVTPEAKLETLAGLGDDTVFVGDGINDAPALAGADTGIAMGSGTDVAIEAAEVVLMQPDPSAVPLAVRLSRSVMRNIRQNLFWAFAYNALLIPVAMGLLVPFGGPQLSPMLAAAAMAMSSVFVVTNALRLRRFS
ncbi:heavy metal translocating P-type ATPase [Paracoccus aerodenitrificans]|uniref:heavy metal translocating P-type ATPase n=1 Tax=Paracoccus aerodenitrificans TaxID=3017781 RepID=UPI0022F12854|nr:heavy metal translocating P-type ATPase [Paracoccus aerodenitrificans]WBU63233.1 heavy metal translocating P-type ATPase [Paracoccus aerodenitrificans]